MKYFKDIDAELFKDTVVLLDIDGTVCVDKGEEILGPEKDKIAELSKVAKKVIFVSNGEHARTKSFSHTHEVFHHTSEYKKPNRNILQKIRGEFELEKEDIVVVGDKFLTDGLLAWQTRAKFIHVKSLQRDEEKLINKAIFAIDDILGNITECLRLMRPQQWIKNFLVFTPAFFAGSIFAPGLLMESFLAFLIFSLSASFVYVVNDIQDRTSDREHGKKKWRPLPSHNISPAEAIALSVLLIAGVVLSILAVPSIWMIISIYIVANIFYTFKFKHIPIFDVVLIASMYVMRVVAGGVVTGVFISPWIICCTFFASLFLISCKRYVEFSNPVRAVLKRYTKESLLGLIIISANLSIISYVMYAILGTHIKHAIYTSPFVIAAFLIMMNDIFNGEKSLETPELYLLRNRHIRFVVLGWIVCMYVLVYNSYIL